MIKRQVQNKKCDGNVDLGTYMLPKLEIELQEVTGVLTVPTVKSFSNKFFTLHTLIEEKDDAYMADKNLKEKD